MKKEIKVNQSQELATPPTEMETHSELSAGRELDALIAERAMGLTKVERVGERLQYFNAEMSKEFGGRFSSIVPHYSTDIAAAMEVVERFVADKWEVSLEHHPLYIDPWHVTLYKYRDGCPPKTRFLFTSEAESLPVAICRAALQAANTAEPEQPSPTD